MQQTPTEDVSIKIQEIITDIYQKTLKASSDFGTIKDNPEWEVLHAILYLEPHLTKKLFFSPNSGAEKYMTTTKSGSEQMHLYPYMFLHIWRSVLWAADKEFQRKCMLIASW